MAITLVGTKGAVAASTSGGSVTPAWGTGETRAVGHLLFCVVTGEGTGTFPATPSGWSVAKQAKFVTNVSGSVTVFQKIATGGDTAPTIAGVASTILHAQLMEFAGNAGTPVLDKTASASTNGSPEVATAASADVHAGDLVLAAALVQHSSARTITSAHTLNNGAAASSTNNASTSATFHYDFAHGITTGNLVADSDSYAFTTGASFVDDVVVLASFKAAILGAAARSETLALVAAGVRKALGAVALSETLAFVAAGVRKAFGAAAIGETLALVAAGFRTAFGASALDETLTFTAAGTRTVYGSAALDLTLGISTSGTRTASGAASLELDLALSASGRRSTYGTAHMPLTFTFTSAGTVTHGSALVFSPATVGGITQLAVGDLGVYGVGRVTNTVTGTIGQPGSDPVAVAGRIAHTTPGRITKATRG